MKERDIYPIFWPAFSSDLNPIETIWNRMNDILQKQHAEKMSYDQLRVAVKAAWDAIPGKELQELVRSMKALELFGWIETRSGHLQTIYCQIAVLITTASNPVR